MTMAAKKVTSKKGTSKTTKKSKVRVAEPSEVLWEPEKKSAENELIYEGLDSTVSTEVTSSDRSVATLDPVVAYMNQIKKYPLLTREEEKALAIKYYETKDSEAAQRLVTSNLRFVVKVAAEYSKFGAKMIDVIQEGNVGLMHAIREFNPYKGVRLISYAVWWIKGYIHEYLMKQYSVVKIGTTQAQRKLYYNLHKERAALEAMGEEPTFALLSTRLGVKEEDVELMSQRLGSKDVSLNQPLDEEGGRSLLDQQSDAEELPLDDKLALKEQIEILREKVEELRPQLSEREQIILDERLLSEEPLTLQEIGDKYKITRQAVNLVEIRILKKLKELLVGEG